MRFLDSQPFTFDELEEALLHANQRAKNAVPKNIRLHDEANIEYTYRTLKTFCDSKNGDGDGRLVHNLEEIDSC